MLWTECLHNPKIMCWSLSHTVIVFGGGALRKRLGHEDNALVNEINAPYKRGSGEFPGPFCHVGTQKTAVYKTESGLLPNT